MQFDFNTPIGSHQSGGISARMCRQKHVIVGASRSHDIISKASSAVQGAYRYLVSNAGGTNSTQEVTLEVHPSGLPMIQLNLGANGIPTLSTQVLPSVPCYQPDF